MKEVLRIHDRGIVIGLAQEEFEVTIFGCYVPPTQSSVKEDLLRFMDNFLAEPPTHIIITGDLNEAVGPAERSAGRWKVHTT